VAIPGSSWCKKERPMTLDPNKTCVEYSTAMYTNPVAPGPFEAWVALWCSGSCGEPETSPLTDLSQCECN
jgi:hypothetical protein